MRFAEHAMTRSAEHGPNAIKSVKSGYGLLAGMKSREGWDHVQRIYPFLPMGQNALSGTWPQSFCTGQYKAK